MEMKKKVLESLLAQMRSLMLENKEDEPLKKDELSEVMENAKEEAAESEPAEEVCEPEEELALPVKKKPMLSVSIAAIKASRPKQSQPAKAILPSKKK